MIQIGALWRGITKNGDEYFSGTLGNKARLVIFLNGYKKTDKHPDYLVYIAENKSLDDDGDDEEHKPPVSITTDNQIPF